VVALELGRKVPPRVIAIAWHRDRYRSRAAELFVELASEVCAALELEPRPSMAAVG
jgi:DNA-binding transcriptional LysR family regulator